MSDKLVKVRVDGKVYLCEMNEHEAGIDLLNALELAGPVNKGEADAYIKAGNLKNLKKIGIGGASTYCVTALDIDEKNILRRRFEDMAIVKEHAMAIMENKLFTEQ